jgi:hypothetical protein
MEQIHQFDWALVISALLAGITSLINTILNYKIKRITVDASRKLDNIKEESSVARVLASKNQKKLEDIHQSTNGNCDELKEQLRAKTSQCHYLQRLIDELVSQLPASAAKSAKVKAKRRYDDFLDRKAIEGNDEET